MPRELNPLPCPACGAHPELGGSQDGSELWIACGNLKKCRMAGPTRTTIAEAVDAWNALPRALEWTNEPQLGAWNWGMDGTSCIPCFVYRDGQVSVAMPLERIPYKTIGGQWAGPIPEPSEQK